MKKVHKAWRFQELVSGGRGREWRWVEMPMCAGFRRSAVGWDMSRDSGRVTCRRCLVALGRQESHMKAVWKGRRDGSEDDGRES